MPRISAIICLSVCLIFSLPKVKAQNGVPINGVDDTYNEVYAFINATLIKDAQTKIENGVLIVSKGLIQAIGKDIKIPAGSRIVDLKGYWIYPSFIDPWTEYGIEKAGQKADKPGPQFLSSKHGPWYWNEAIHPEMEASAVFSIQKEEAKTYRDLGFGVVASHSQNGIARGLGLVTHLGEKPETRQIIESEAGQFFSFNKGNSTQDYPSSLMGSIALLRQFYYDAKWYKGAKQEEVNRSLQLYNKNSNLSHFFEVGDAQEILRADKLGDEFGIQYIIKSKGDEYQFIKEVRETKAPLIIPIDFPEAFDVEDPLDARLINLTELQHWENAPFNPYVLYSQGIDFALTSAGMKKKENFLPNLRRAIENGLPEEYALKALTAIPSKYLGVESRCGTLEQGKFANFLVCDGNIFKQGSAIVENWVLGQAYPLVDRNTEDFRGKYSVKFGDSTLQYIISGKPWNQKAVMKSKSAAEIKIMVKNGLLSFHFYQRNERPVIGTAYKVGRDLLINYQDSTGKAIKILSKFLGELEASKDSVKAKPELKVPMFKWPWKYDTPKAAAYYITNCTVWTCADKAQPKIANVLVKDGKILSISTDLHYRPFDAVEINGMGKHLTPGIIDEHSHIAISKGVNEGTQSITSEVRIEDVINAKDVNIYRQLSGGVTTSHLLHGSANAIGGQTALIKLKYGEGPEQLKFPTDHRFIKFALGENVKQSNWGDRQTSRYPQTRMGVEQVFNDGFTRAMAYAQAKKTGVFRTDLELEALLEILNGKRFITCHSYVQSEINMLMHVADSFGFRVNTFTHILEGYKVADKMKKHGVAASTFADWWAYKYEVIDAIPHNAGILNEVGVITGINSDDAEMGRRLTQEAAKTIKYSGVSEVEALNMVTINPAKMLHIEKRVGSIEIGKDADLVLWDGNPLSNFSKPVTTIIDGQIYFDRTLDLEKRKFVASERKRLIDAMVKAKKEGHSTRKAVKTEEEIYHCEEEENIE